MIKARTLQDLFKRYRRPGDLVFAVLFLCFAVFLALSLPGQTTWTSGKVMAQPAFWPYVAVFSMLGFGALHLVSSLWSPALAGRWQEVAFWLRALEYAGWFMGYVLLVPWIGYLPGTLLVVVALTLRLGYRQRGMILAAVVFGFAVVVVFKAFLQVKVPGGQVYELLPGGLRAFMLTYF